MLSDLKAHKLAHLTPPQQDEIQKLVLKYKHLLSDVPGRTNARVTCSEILLLRKLVVIDLHHVYWCLSQTSFFVFFTDFSRVNSITKTVTFPIPRVDDCIDRIGHVKFVSTLDMLKGYWQVFLTEKAKEITAFTLQVGLYRYQIMEFILKNDGATFQRLSNEVVKIWKILTSMLMI